MTKAARMSLTLAAAALVLGLVQLFSGGNAGAVPPGGPRTTLNLGKKLYSFNILVHPNGWVEDDGVCGNQGHRVFYTEDGGALGTLTWLLNTAQTTFDITKCDGTTDNEAVIEVPQNLKFAVFVRLLGPKTARLTLTCDDIIDVGTDDLCLLDPSVNLLQKEKEFTKIMENVIDPDNEKVLWTFDGATDVKILQVWVYELL